MKEEAQPRNSTLMPTVPVPDEAVQFIRKANVLEWRGFKQALVCTHVTPGLLTEFVPLATDGVIAVVRFSSGRIDRLQLANISWPKNLGRKAKQGKRKEEGSQKKKKLCKLLGLLPEELEALKGL